MLRELKDVKGVEKIEVYTNKKLRLKVTFNCGTVVLEGNKSNKVLKYSEKKWDDNIKPFYTKNGFKLLETFRYGK